MPVPAGRQGARPGVLGRWVGAYVGVRLGVVMVAHGDTDADRLVLAEGNEGRHVEVVRPQPSGTCEAVLSSGPLRSSILRARLLQNFGGCGEPARERRQVRILARRAGNVIGQ